jgi:hypothetical protein
VEFGHIDTHREQVLASRGLTILDQLRFSRRDVKLGLRMLAKYPGLSLVSVIGIDDSRRHCGRRVRRGGGNDEFLAATGRG